MLTLITDSLSEDPSLDAALSRVLLDDVARGSSSDVLRLYKPSRVVAFGKRDTHSPGYREAVRDARHKGFDSVERLAGGRAAVFHEDTIAFAWTIRDPYPQARITQRFTSVTEILTQALGSLGVNAQVGEVPGEYCPGQFSINLEGRHKVVGVGQRLVAGAAHVGGVVVVGGSELVTEVLVPVYRRLSLDWLPETSGDLRMAEPNLAWQSVFDAIVNAFDGEFGIETGSLSEATLVRAKEIAGTFRSDLDETDSGR